MGRKREGGWGGQRWRENEGDGSFMCLSRGTKITAKPRSLLLACRQRSLLCATWRGAVGRAQNDDLTKIKRRSF